MLDYHELQKSRDFKELPESFVIFITENDVLGGGEKIYHIDRIIRETGKVFDDGSHIIYVNGSYEGEVGVPLDDLIHDFFCDNPADMRHKQLANRVKFLKSNEKGVREMSSVMEEVFAEERKQILLNNIRNLMETLNLSVQQAMNALKIPADKQAELKPLL